MSPISHRRRDQRQSGSHLKGDRVAQKVALVPAVVSPQVHGTKIGLAPSPPFRLT